MKQHGQQCMQQRTPVLQQYQSRCLSDASAELRSLCLCVARLFIAGWSVGDCFRRPVAVAVCVICDRTPVAWLRPTGQPPPRRALCRAGHAEFVAGYDRSLSRVPTTATPAGLLHAAVSLADRRPVENFISLRGCQSVGRLTPGARPPGQSRRGSPTVNIAVGDVR